MSSLLTENEQLYFFFLSKISTCTLLNQATDILEIENNNDKSITPALFVKVFKKWNKILTIRKQ